MRRQDVVHIRTHPSATSDEGQEKGGAGVKPSQTQLVQLKLITAQVEESFGIVTADVSVEENCSLMH